MSRAHRIETLHPGTHVRVSLRGQLLAETHDPVELQEQGLPSRWYMRREDVQAELVDSDTHSHCPFKGDASYYSVKLDSGEVVDDLIWYYPEAGGEATEVSALVCFWDEKVDLELDGELSPAQGA